RSKFMAEEIVLDAIENGLNARIFRVGMLTGTVDGRFQRRPERNAFANRIKALCTLGCVPIGALKITMDITPVDACARAMLALGAMLKPRQPIHHVYNTNTMTLGEIISLLELNGNMIEVISDQEFMRKMSQLSKRGDYGELTGLMEDMNAYRQANNIVITAKETQQQLCREGFEWPVIDARYMGRFVDCIYGRQSKEI
ncbi:MAG: SDR family oxidoreductase, partial [Eubacteriales bacterium]|nr:SDR family oxidoreductase [Eubacteriales bacterium]